MSNVANLSNFDPAKAEQLVTVAPNSYVEFVLVPAIGMAANGSLRWISLGGIGILLTVVANGKDEKEAVAALEKLTSTGRFEPGQEE